MMFDELLNKNKQRREADAKKFESLDGNLCILCHAYGADKRSLIVDCGYTIHEAVPEALDLFMIAQEDWFHKKGYFLQICKTCRSEFLQHMAEWYAERIAMRNVPKDHDGNPEESDGDVNAMIPVRMFGSTVLMTPEAYESYQKKLEKSDQNGHGD